MKIFLPVLSLLFVTQSKSYAQATHPYNNCPDVNIAIVRAGMNADVTNPFYLYNVNQSTGAMTVVPGGPYKDPANPTRNLQVNAIGVSRKDGYIYGLAFDGTVTTARFIRLDSTYGVTDLGDIPSPAGTGVIGVVNPAAGDMDTAGNYYFSAFTFTPLPAPAINKFYLGKISNTQNIVTGPPVVDYYEIDVSGANCSAYISTLSTDPNNSGLKDFSYNAKTKSFFTYATYKLPGATNFSGQLLELAPIAGSSPLRYRLICNAIVNTHTAETSGTIIDKSGKFTVLFTDGSFGLMNANSSGVYTGTFTLITTATGLPNPLRGDMGSCGQSALAPQPIPAPGCSANYAIVRAGTNADITNPYYLYRVNQSTGAMTLLPGGPYKDPANPTRNLQINGFGVNSKDSRLYGLAFDGTVTVARFMRLDTLYGVTDLGDVPSPAGTGVIGVVNPAAGDVDTAGNYYFSAFTMTPLPAPTINKFYIGKIANTQTITTGPPVVDYFEVDVSGANCSAYISTLTTDPTNSGLKDFSYSAKTNSFFTYATYKLPGAANFSGQLLELLPIAGSSPLRYRLICNSIVNTHTAETAGTLIDGDGKFTVLFTDGSFGMLNTNASGVYTGAFTLIATNAGTGLPNPLRGDMGSGCQGSKGPVEIPLPVSCPANFAAVRAGTNADITNPYSLYTVNGTTGALTLLPGGPLYYPGTTQTLQINGIGVNKQDGFIYGMAYEGSLTTARFVKTDANYNVTLMGNIPAPVSTSGSPSFINSAAGDINNGNYYFTAVTTKPGTGPGSLVIDKLWLGKIANVSTVTGTPSPTYYEVEWNGNQCTDFINSLNNDPVNSGVKDLFYHPVTRTFFSYVTYRLPGQTQYTGQMVELKPVGNPNSPNRYHLQCKNVINMHTAETSGTMVTNEGEFIILMTDGTVGRIPRTGNSYNYSGNYIVLNSATGLPPVIRADLASCTDLFHPSENGNNGDQSDRNKNKITFSLQPNPVEFGQTLMLRWTAVTRPELVDVIVYDSYGTVVRRISNVLAIEGDQLSINVGNLAAGIFYVKAISKNGKTDFELKFLKAN